MGDPLNLRTLLIYKDPTDAYKAKRLLERRGCYARLFPVPKGVSFSIGGCGVCVAVEDIAFDEVFDPEPIEIVKLPTSVLDAFFEVERDKSESAGPRSG